MGLRRFGAVQHGGIQAALLVRFLEGEPADVEWHPLGFGADGQLSHITSMTELPKRGALVTLVKQAAKLNAGGVTGSVMSGPRTPRSSLPVPADLKRALSGNTKAGATFENFPPSHQREYVEWIIEAKREETRARRVALAVEWLSEGKSRNWKYMK